MVQSVRRKTSQADLNTGWKEHRHPPVPAEHSSTQAGFRRRQEHHEIAEHQGTNPKVEAKSLLRHGLNNEKWEQNIANVD